MRKFKFVTFMLVLVATKSALAFVSCAGETYGGRIVLVNIETQGSMAYASSGSVTTIEADGKVSHYSLLREEIVQFFESADGSRAIVGLAAYQGMNNPLWIKYVGENYEGDLLKTLRDPQRKKQSGNEMRVWRGPGFGADQQSQFTDVVCSVVIDA